MGRMHSGGKGISTSAKPCKRSPPSWLKISSQDMKRKRQSDDVSEQLRELEKIVKEMKEDWNTWLLYEKAKDDLIRAVLIKEHPDLIRTLPPFPIHLLWQSAEPQPTHLE